MAEALKSPSTTLPFSDDRQEAVLGHLLDRDNPWFFLQCHGKLKPEWFFNPMVARLYRGQTWFYERYQRIPSIEDLMSIPDISREDMAERKRLAVTVMKCRQLAGVYGLDAIVPEMTNWMHSIIYFQAVKSSATLYNAQKPEAAFDIIKNAGRQIQEMRFERDEERKFTDYQALLDAQFSEYQNALTWGLDCFDRLLTPEATSGSLLEGDTTVVLAPVNTGKTSTLITVAVNNILRGKDILFITHEGRPSDIQMKIWCSILNVSKSGLMALYQTEEGRKKMNWALSYINKHLVYVPMNKAGLTIEEVEGLIRQRQHERMVANGGRGFHMLINDYPAKLTTREASGGRMSRRDNDDKIYGYFVQFALEYKFHCLSVIQTNREGSRVNRHEKGEDRLLTMEDVMESFGPMTSATNVISINRSPLAESKGLITFYICKSRSSEKGWAVACRSNYQNSITHSNELGATWYRGTATMDDKIDSLLTEYRNKAVPETKFL